MKSRYSYYQEINTVLNRITGTGFHSLEDIIKMVFNRSPFTKSTVQKVLTFFQLSKSDQATCQKNIAGTTLSSIKTILDQILLSDMNRDKELQENIDRKRELVKEIQQVSTGLDEHIYSLSVVTGLSTTMINNIFQSKVVILNTTAIAALEKLLREVQKLQLEKQYQETNKIHTLVIPGLQLTRNHHGIILRNTNTGSILTFDHRPINIKFGNYQVEEIELSNGKSEKELRIEKLEAEIRELKAES